MRVGGVKTVVVVLLGLVAGANIGGAQQAEVAGSFQERRPEATLYGQRACARRARRVR